MFKIQENADGSTSVYHKKTGQHMCTIPVKPNSSTPLRINVVEPQPSCNATVVVKDWRLSNFKDKVPDESSTEESSDDDLKSRSSSCRLSSPEPSDEEEGPSDPAEAFARALGLLPAGREPSGTWPLRRVSRVPPGLPRLITELTPLSCAMGGRLLREDPRMLLGKEAQRVQAVRKYEGLCVAAGLPPSEPNACHARLRCRDRRPAYPVCTTSRTMRAESTHVYSFGRRQRRERLRVIETGLDKRSRQLLTLCRPCEVRLERLPKEEIRRWRRRRPPQSFLVQTPLADRRMRDVRVRLPDITVCILGPNIRDGHYYLAGTRIRVADYAEFLAARPRTRQEAKNGPIPVIDLTLDSPPKKSSSSCRVDNRLPNGNASRQRTTSLVCAGESVLRRDSSRPIQLQVGGRSLLSRPPQTNHCRQRPTAHSSVQQRQGNNSVQRQGNNSVQRQGNSSVQQRQGSNSVQQRAKPQGLGHGGQYRVHGPVLSAMLQERLWPTHFRCFACGCNRYISHRAETEVLEHMRRFHSVAEPDRFLTVYRDQVKRCTIVEAFPGYKGNND